MPLASPSCLTYQTHRCQGRSALSCAEARPPGGGCRFNGPGTAGSAGSFLAEVSRSLGAVFAAVAEKRGRSRKNSSEDSYFPVRHNNCIGRLTRKMTLGLRRKSQRKAKDRTLNLPSAINFA